MSEAGVKAVVKALEGSLEYWQVRRAMKEEIIKPTYSIDDLESEVPRLMEQMGLATRIRNFAFAMRERLPVDGAERDAPGDGSADMEAREATMLEGIAVARRMWKRKVAERVNLLSTRSGIPLSYPARDEVPTRPASASGEISSAAAIERMEFTEALHTDVGHAYIDVELLDALEGIQRGSPGGAATVSASPQPGQSATTSGRATSGGGGGVGGAGGGPAGTPSAGGKIIPTWGVLQVELKTPDITWLRSFFKQLGAEHRQVGIDDNILAWFASQQRAEGENLAHERFIPSCRAYARTGVPTALRPAIWAAALGVEPGGKARSHFDRLCSEVARRELLVDSLCAGDVHDIVDHAHFFPFEETLRAVLCAFMRDTAVPGMCAVLSHPRLTGIGRKARLQGAYPPSGVVPFHGLTLYVAPLCYLFPHPADVYVIFRELYCRHFVRLHVLSDEGVPSPALPVLCKTFEDLLHAAEPEMCFHLLRLGIPPLRVAFPWMIHAFVGHLEVEQVLLLWDRIIGFDSVLLLAIAAAAIFSFRRDAVLAATSRAELYEAMEDMTQIQIIPLVQDFLFNSNQAGGTSYAYSGSAA